MKTTETYLTFETRVHLPTLREHLCGNRDKLPADFTCDKHVTLHTLSGGELRPLGVYHIVVVPTPTLTSFIGRHPRKSSKHRIFAKFGARLIPVGRLHQAKKPEPIDPPGC